MPTMLSCIARAGGKPSTCLQGSPRGWGRWAYSFTPTRRTSSTARTTTVSGRARAHQLHLPRVRLPAPEGAQQARGELHLVLACDRPPRRSKPKATGSHGLRIHRRTDLTLDDLAEWLNPIIAGWMHYYGRYYRTVLHPLLRRVNLYVRRWAGKKYRRLRTYERFKRWWTGILNESPICSPNGSGSARPETLVRRAR